MAVDENQQLMNNGNIHKFITVNSLISGTIYMQVVMSKQSFNLNTKLSKNLYVKSNKNNSSNGNHMFDDNEFELMMGGVKSDTYSNKVSKQQSSEEDEEESDKSLEEEEVSDSCLIMLARSGERHYLFNILLVSPQKRV